MRKRVLVIAAFLVAMSAALHAGVGPVIDSFVVTPPVPAPGQAVTITVTAHDPDCATTCSTGCGLIVRNDLVFWSDDTGRTPTPFQGQQSGASGSPFTTQVTWIAPPSSGTFNVSLQLNDNGGMLCGGRKTTLVTYPVTVTNAQPPVIDSFVATPATVRIGGSADLSAIARDPGGLPLTYTFTADAGTVTQSSPSSATARWTAPQVAGNITVRVKVSNGATSVSSQVMVNVQAGAYLRSMRIADSKATRFAAFADGRMAVVDGANGVLQLLGSTGTLIWRASNLATPTSVVISGGQLFVLERSARRISVWDSSGNRLREMTIAASSANDIAEGPATGELCVTDTNASRVLVISVADGRVLREVGVGTLTAPAGIATSNGRIAVADIAIGKVLVFDAAGNPANAVGDSTTLVRPQGLAWDATGARFIVTDSFSGEIVLVGEENAIRGSLSGFGTEAGQLVNPVDVTLLADGSAGVTTASGDISFFQLFLSLAPVAAPTQVAAIDHPGDDGGAIDVSWMQSSDDPARVTGYVVERSTGETGDFTNVAQLAKGVTSHRDSGVLDTNCYHYRVVATDGVNRSTSTATPCVASRNDVPPPPPAGVTATAASPTQVTVRWIASGALDVTGYLVDVGTVSLRVGLVSEATVAGLAAGTDYQVGVRAIDNGNNLSTAALTTVRTPADAPPAAPTAVTVTDRRTGGALDVAWIQPDGSDGMRWTVTLTPRTPGWPVVVATTTSGAATVDHLVNELVYDATVVAETTWGARSEPSTPAHGKPTDPGRQLPVVEETTAEEVSGVVAEFALEGDLRELRFQYRSDGATLQAYLDGQPAGQRFGDTAGAWAEGVLFIDRASLPAAEVHRLELRNASFPDPAAALALRRIDLVPLAPRDVTAASLNTTVDVRWSTIETRRDLVPLLTRVARAGVTQAVKCEDAASLCRDTFVANGEELTYRLALQSPAGWSSEAVDAAARPSYDAAPPPVTDARFRRDGNRILLDWTKLSTATSETSAPVPVASYRIYRADEGQVTFVGETAGPPFVVSEEFPFVVRSVDAQGRESR